MENQPISVIFVTHNRKELLHQAIKAIKQQSVPVEVIVMDDASTDHTEEMMRTDYPEVIYARSPVSEGPSHQRNEGAKKASSDIIIFLDDDTVAVNKHLIRDTLRDFEQPTIGSVAIPFINVLQNNQVQNGAPDTNAVYLLHSFIGAAFAVKRDLFLSIGGFRPEYFYMGEEGDFCIRLLEAGYYIKAGTAVPAHHHQPPNRVSYRADFYGRRNDIFFLYLNSPRQYLLLTIASTIFKGLIWGIKQGRLKNMGEGMVAGLTAMFKGDFKDLKKPVTNSIFWKFHYLKKYEPLPFSQLI